MGLDTAASVNRGLDPPMEFHHRQVMAISGISYRQIQWWDENNCVRANIVAHTRFYSPEDTILIAVLSELRRKGLSLQLCRKLRSGIIKSIEKAAWEPRAWLITDKKRVGCITSLEDIYTFQSDRPVMLVDINPILRMVRGAVQSANGPKLALLHRALSRAPKQEGEKS